MKNILLTLIPFFYSLTMLAQMNISDQQLNDYLASVNVSKDQFKSEEAMLLYLVDQIEKSSRFYYLAADLSRISNKSPQLLEAIHKKILQCFLETQKEISTPYTGIVSGFLTSSQTAYEDYVLFLENLLSENSKQNNEAYLEDIALRAPKVGSKLFSLEEKIRILAAKHLLMFDADHPMATSFFTKYPIKTRTEPVEQCFIFKENEWSGYGLIGSDGEWVLPPFYQFYYQDQFGFNEGWLNFYVINNTYPNNQRTENAKPSFALGSWVNKKGAWLTDEFVCATNRFKYGSARFGAYPNYNYINTEGVIDSVKMISTFRVLDGGYELKGEKGMTNLYNPQNKKIASLTKEFAHAEVILQDALIGFANIPGFPGEAEAGYMDMDGKILVEPSFLINSDDGYQFPSFNGFDVMVVRDKSRLAGLVNRNFELIIPFEYDDLRIKNSKYILGEKKGKYFLFDHKGNLLPSPAAVNFKDYQNNCKGQYCLSRENYKQIIVNLDAKPIERYDGMDVKLYYKDVFICAKENKYGVLDHNLNEIIPFEYNKVLWLPGNKYIYLEGNDLKCHWVDEGKTYDLPIGFMPDAYAKQYSYRIMSDFIPGTKAGKSGVVDTKGQVIVPFENYYLSISHVLEN